MAASKKKASIICQALKGAGINFGVYLPETWLKEVNALLTKDPQIKYVGVTREEEGVGVAAGASLGGKRAALIVDVTGLGNSITALLGIHRAQRIPLLILASHRGSIGEREAFLPEGWAWAGALLQDLRIPYSVLTDVQAATRVIRDSQKTAEAQRAPVAVLLAASALLEEE